jgi:hemolysin activation/secretion protein
LRIPGRMIWLLALAFSAGAGDLANSQTAPSQVAPPEIPPAPQLPARISIPVVPPGAALPEQAKRLRFVLTEFAVQGEFEELVAVRRELAAPLLGKRVSVVDVFDFASALQQAYVRAGYPLVRVTVAPQELGARARVRIIVIDGFIEQIDATALSPFVRERVLAVVSPLLRHRHLTQPELERQLLIAGEAPGLEMSATFAAGKQVGGSILILSGRFRPVSMSFYIDNAMPKTFGGFQAVGVLALNSPTGHGEQFWVSAAGLPDGDFASDDPTRRYLSASFAIPLGISGWKFETIATDGKTTPRVDPTAASQGHLQQLRTRLAYDLIKTRDVELTLSGRFDATNEQIDSLVLIPSAPLSLDRLRVPRLAIDGIWRRRETGTTIFWGATWSHGISGLGARTAAEAGPLLPLSRAGADATFDKIDYRFELVQALPWDLLATITTYGQYSFNEALLTSEQFDITGPRMLSGFTAGALPGDTSWVLRGELAHAVSLPIEGGSVVMVPYAFGAVGERRLMQPTVLEIPSIQATNFGLGVRLNSAPANDNLPNASAFIEYSRRHSSDDPTLTGSRIFAGALIRY